MNDLPVGFRSPALLILLFLGMAVGRDESEISKLPSDRGHRIGCRTSGRLSLALALACLVGKNSSQFRVDYGFESKYKYL